MKIIVLYSSIFFLFVIKPSSVIAQYTFFKPEGSFAVEVSLENTDMKRIPIYRNAITSLSVTGNNVIGGTSAEENMAPFLFSVSLDKREVTNIFDIDKIIKGQNAIRSGFVKDGQEQLYAGTIPNKLNQSGGHLLKIKIDHYSQIHVEDLGIPVSGEGIFTIAGNNEKNELYGITYPSGYFFSYNLKSGKTKIFKDIAPPESVVHSLEDQFSLKPEDLLSNALVVDNQGRVYGSLPYGKLFCFDSNNETFKELESELPEVWGRRSLGQVHSWIKTKTGKIYGGNRADGQLFELDPSTKKVKNIGKPIMMPGLAGLAEGADGKIYGVAGEKPGYAHLFCYDEQNGFKDFGNPEFEMVAPGIEQGILWRGYQLGTIVSSDDGRYIVMGENESLSQLLIFTVN